MRGRMPLPPIPICPQEPWEAQEEAHRDRSRSRRTSLGGGGGLLNILRPPQELAPTAGGGVRKKNLL